MIPILYPATEAAFDNNGLGGLSDAIEVSVEEKRNGSYELEMEYPVDGRHYSEIGSSSIIVSNTNPSGNPQPFRVYRMAKPMNGRVRIYAQHVSYQMSKIPVAPFTAPSVSAALLGIKSNAVETCPFTFWTDKQTVADFQSKVPASMRSLLGGSQGSILDVYGGEWEFDWYTAKLHSSRGQNRGIVIEYGKNLLDLKQEESIEKTITGVYPYWERDGALVQLPEHVISSPTAANYPYPRTEVLDCTDAFTGPPTVAQLRSYAQAYISREGIGIPAVNLKVDFVSLADTEEYRNLSRENIFLCDTVQVKFERLGVSTTAKVITCRFDVLRERYSLLEIGDARSTFAQETAKLSAEVKSKPSVSFMEAFVDAATELLTGVLGGCLRINRNANGKPYELLIMDTEDISTAQNIWRFNQNGWGHSKTGYAGPYNAAATLDDGIIATYIVTGILRANLIKAGILSDEAGLNFWNMETGEFSLSNGNFHVDANGVLTAIAGEIAGWLISRNWLYKECETTDSGGNPVTLTTRISAPNSEQSTVIYSAHKEGASEHALFYITANGNGWFSKVTAPLFFCGASAMAFSCVYGFSFDGPVTFDGAATFGGAATFNGNVTIGSSDNNRQFLHHGNAFHYGHETLYGTLYLGKVVNGSGVSYGRIYTPTDHELYFYVGSDVNRAVKLAQDNGHWGLFPYGDTYLDLGLSNHRWDNIYAQNGAIQTSDRRQKKDIKDLPKKALEFVRKLRPVSFLMRKGTSGRRHWGFVAQDVEQIMQDVGFTPLDFAGIIKDEEGRYGLRYEEFLAPLTMAVQELEKRVEALERRING